MAAGVSVIVCCYNSSSRLSETLNHLINQKVNGIGFEIIIVDNASTDNTFEFAKGFLEKAPSIDYGIVKEPESGLSYARKKGYAVAKYEYLLFCDDDNWLDENYIQLAYQTMSQHPQIGILGGFASAVFESEEPSWFKQFELDFAVGDQSTSPLSLSQLPEVYGAGFIIRKTYLDKLYASGFKSILSDRKGNELVSGGDTELCYLAKYFGYEVWYNRELRLKHFMAKGRLNWSYLKRLYVGKGKTLVYTRAYQRMELSAEVPNQKLRLPFWLDTFIYKARQVLNSYRKVCFKMNDAGDKEVLKYIATRAEAMEIWNLKGRYSQLFYQIVAYQNAGKASQ